MPIIAYTIASRFNLGMAMPEAGHKVPEANRLVRNRATKRLPPRRRTVGQGSSSHLGTGCEGRSVGDPSSPIQYGQGLDVSLPPDVATIVSKLTSFAHPRAIILFGSRARGDHSTHSDWDLCVVLEQDADPNAASPIKLWNHVRGLGLPVDIVVTKPAELLEAAGDVNSLAHRIVSEGRLLSGTMFGTAE